jgi:Holliday junction resolvase-like predicted endonuclease
VLKNSSETIKFDSGLKSELAVVRLLQNRKYICEFHRFKTKIAEIDLIFSKGNRILLVEVKSLNNDWRAFERIGQDQQIKLKNNLGLFSRAIPNYEFSAWVCWVNKSNIISFAEA